VDSKITLICTPLRFYTQDDEAILFNWLKKVSCIKKIQGIARELHLESDSNTIPDQDLLNLMAIFDRYKFDNTQLTVFMNANNKDFFTE
jgi:hypothetical protein